MAEMTPMMKQYLEIKKEYQDTILMFRLGDFYEMFFEDAKVASRELELVLTGRDCGQAERAPMCGVPFHSVDSYIARLVSRGYKVAICEQTEDPATAKGIVKRDVIRVLTPGTVIESSMLDESKNNFLCSIWLNGNAAGICFADVSTGELSLTQLDSKSVGNEIVNELGRYMPTEIRYNSAVVKNDKIREFIKNRVECTADSIDEEKINVDYCRRVITNHFKKSLTELAIEESNEAVCALGATIDYLTEVQKSGLDNIREIDFYSENQFMKIDFSSRRNLELTETMRNRERRGTLLWVLDKTKTAMGKRLMRSWLEHPLLNITSINNRQSAIEELVNDNMLRMDVTDTLSGIFDIERLMTRIVYGSANARDLRSLCGAIQNLPQISDLLVDCKSVYLKYIYKSIDKLEDIHSLIDSAIVEEPPFTVREGGMIKRGYNEELDSVTGDMNDSKGILARIEDEQRDITGIPKLKVGYNRVFGYYIEVSNSYKSMVPETYIRKQTLTNCERYITQDLKDVEGRILGAKDRSVALEYNLFDDVRKTVSDNLERIQKTAKAIANLDVITSLANVAADNRYIRPDVNLSTAIRIKDSRHPVVEALLKDAPFVPNDVSLDSANDRVAIITGPNMAGKSTYMRQIAIIVLMAQIGSFVPASSAEIGIVDSIFTRVGASDDLASGQSTFMVEMSEVANIIKNATSKSLLILDEIGRGTSTFDGMSIARAVLEFCADRKKLGAKTLFATHYHELTVMEQLLDGVKNYNIAVKKRGDDITFLRRIVPGGADDSYGIEVAKLAGIPQSVISRAKEILKDLEHGKYKNEDANIQKQDNSDDMQLSLIGSAESPVIEKLKDTDINTLTPIEAMNLLYELKGMI